MGPQEIPVMDRFTGKGPKNPGCEEKNRHPAGRTASTDFLTLTYAPVKVRRNPHFSRLPVRVSASPPGCEPEAKGASSTTTAARSPSARCLPQREPGRYPWTLRSDRP